MLVLNGRMRPSVSNPYWPEARHHMNIAARLSGFFGG